MWTCYCIPGRHRVEIWGVFSYTVIFQVCMGRKEFFMKNIVLKLNLQRFADDGQSEGGEESNTNPSETEVKEDVSGDTKPFKTFDTQSEMDSFFDKKLAKALDTARSKWEKEQNDKAQKAKDLKNMSPEERQNYELKQREQALVDREANITKRENKNELASKLIEDGLPAELVDVFDDVLADKDKMTDTYQKVSEVFRGAVHDAVETRLAQSARPPKSLDGNHDHKSPGEIYAEKANNSQKSKSDFWNLERK